MNPISCLIPSAPPAYQLDILGALTQTGIQQTAAGGKARAFCDIVGDQLGKVETNEFLNLGETLIHYATGQNLDFLGEIFGVYRLGQQIASISQRDLNFRFYVAGGGKFGDINSGQAINLPVGMLILSAASNGPIFITDTAYPEGHRYPAVRRSLLCRTGQFGQRRRRSIQPVKRQHNAL